MINELRGILLQEQEQEVIYELRPSLKRCKYILGSGHQCQLADGHVGRHAWEPTWVERVAQIEAEEREAPLVKPEPKRVDCDGWSI